VLICAFVAFGRETQGVVISGEGQSRGAASAVRHQHHH
jgi:SHS family lactate transporter-like MFS transporter